MATNTIVPLNDNLGIQPVGNGTGSNSPGPTSILQGAQTKSSPTSPYGVTALASGTTGATTAIPVTTATSSSSNQPGALINATSSSQNSTSNELNNIFGSGVGGLINSEIANLGSQNSSYMQNYENAMAPENAENLASLQTTLGNEGVGANSSTAAIAQSNFETGVSSQEGLQEQQLQMNDLSQLLGLTESIEQPAQEAQQNTWESELGSVLGEVGGTAGGIMLGGALSNEING